jgi:hypothetical protein
MKGIWSAAFIVAGLVSEPNAGHSASLYDMDVTDLEDTSLPKGVSDKKKIGKKKRKTDSEDFVPAYTGSRPIGLPYPDAGIGTWADIAPVQMRMMRCQTRPYSSEIDSNREVQATLPVSMDVLDRRLVNTVLVAALHFTQENCTYRQSYFFIDPYLSISATIVQQGEIVVRTSQTDTVRGRGSLIFDHVSNIRADRAERVETARQSQEAWDRFWAKVRMYFWIAVATVVGGFFLRHLPTILTHVRYRLSPHPAISEIKLATRSRNPKPTDGRILAEALTFAPRNPVEAQLARRDIEKMHEQVKNHNEILAAHEALARKVEDMERARTRVEELQRRRTGT